MQDKTIVLKWQNKHGNWWTRYKGIPVKVEDGRCFEVIWDFENRTRCNSLSAVVEIIDSTCLLEARRNTK